MVAVMYCPQCGTQGKPKTRTKGSIGIEAILWMCYLFQDRFFVPGVIYSVWRMATKEKVCPKCGAPDMIPLDSPLATSAHR